MDKLSTKEGISPVFFCGQFRVRDWHTEAAQPSDKGKRGEREVLFQLDKNSRNASKVRSKKRNWKFIVRRSSSVLRESRE